tara:strand:- start:959 stop:1441 length:483 start_codon:yes stop_codon:yes gene_type:complete
MRPALGVALSLGASAALATVVFAQVRGESVAAMPDLNPGEGWQKLEPTAIKDGRSQAWSDPAAGCHLVAFELPVTDSVGVEPMRKQLGAVMAKANLAISDEASGNLRITGKGITGLAALSLIESPTRSAKLLACYWNEREPARCQSICQRVLQEQSKASL